MASFPNPITNENFSVAWRIGCRKYKDAKVKAAIRRIAKPIAELLFFPGFLVLAFGASMTFSTPNVSALIGRVPILSGLWQQLEALLFASADTVPEQILRAAIALYAIPLAVFLIVALIVVLVYHPRTYAVSGNAYQDSQALWTMARHALTESRSKGKDVSGTLALISGILAALGALAVIFYWLLVPGGEDVLAGIGVANTLKLFALALILIFSYSLVVLPLTLLMRLVCWTPISRHFPERAESYCRGQNRGPFPVAAAPVPAAAAPAAQAVAAEPPVAEQPEAPAEAPAETPAEAAVEPTAE